jgi:hypothetical protein
VDFTLGDHTFIEEFDHYKGKLTKLKLYLPVKRKKEQESIFVRKTIDGGLYASLTTIAYGAMTGVLDLLYNWLYQNVDYIQDELRHWYARYILETGKDLERKTRVTCYVPVILINKTLNI